MTDFLAACSPGSPRRLIKPLNTCRMAVGNVFQADLQLQAACILIGILSVNPHCPREASICAIVLPKGDPYEKNIGSDHDTDNDAGGRCRPVGE